jgi:hypothetical protein
MHCARSIAAATLLMMGLSACQPSDTDTSKNAASPASAPSVATAPAPTGPVTIEPASLTSCETGAVVTVRWDIRKEHPDVKDIEVWTGSATHPLTLFTASGTAGEAKTGPWAGPGSIFAVKDRATGQELARATVQGPACL